MKRSVAVVVAAFMLASGAAFAQSHQPYAGLETRPIKALSEQQIDDLKAGRGAGLALAAELNGYPGPAHLLELSDKLGLSSDQRTRIQQLFDSMKQEALPLGANLLQQEAELDRQFADHTITREGLKAATAGIANTQGALRETHLKYHLSTVELLTESQRQRYAALRGYRAHDANGPHRPR